MPMAISSTASVGSDESDEYMRRVLKRFGIDDVEVLYTLSKLSDDHTLANKVHQRLRKDRFLGWGKFRKAVYDVITSYAYELGLGLVVIVNVVLFIMEVDIRASCEDEVGDCTGMLYSVANAVLLALYTLDASLRMFALRRRWFRDAWNWVDAATVICGFAELLLPVLLATESSFLGYVRILRLGRLMRASKIMKPFPVLHKIIMSVFHTLRALAYGSLLILIMLLLWAIITVEMMEPIRERNSDEMCSIMLSSVAKASLFYFQTLIAGDSWGLCIIPIVLEHPYMFLTFACALVSVQLGFMNLILAVIVDAAAEVRESDNAEQAKNQRRLMQEHIVGLYLALNEIDADHDGSISKHELLTAYDCHPQLAKKLANVGMRKSDLESLYGLMVESRRHVQEKTEEYTEGSEDLQEVEEVALMTFMDEILRAEKNDMRLDTAMIKLQIQTMDAKLNSLQTVDAKLSSVLALLSTSQQPSKKQLRGYTNGQIGRSHV
eukprot:TRINITY_DN66622_c0_g1_i1.p1 TRINITY_DN66622_c0_g1~~TRINITY_DN66622_c0_g1_i1.p1  ORF type:complete len:493 (-),score=70.88 TRINITY_DN66622_c0_g1_i1:15-1493(-)